MTVVPKVIPRTTPLVFTIAIAVFALDQVPPVVPLASVTVLPLHTIDGPVMTGLVGSGFTVTVVVMLPVPAV